MPREARAVVYLPKKILGIEILKKTDQDRRWHLTSEDVGWRGNFWLKASTGISWRNSKDYADKRHQSEGPSWGDVLNAGQDDGEFVRFSIPQDGNYSDILSARKSRCCPVRLTPTSDLGPNEGDYEAAVKAKEQAEGTDGAVVPKARARDMFRWRPLPWWLCFFLGVFLLYKFKIVYNESPCSVLGTPSPVTQGEVKRAFRTLSMCTHPDRLRGRLGRTPTASEERRGDIIFKRAATAKEDLFNAIAKKSRRGKKKSKKGKKKQEEEEPPAEEESDISVQCYSGEMESAFLQVFEQIKLASKHIGAQDIIDFVVDFVKQLVTFEAGIVNTIMSLMWAGFVFRMFKGLFSFVWNMGIFMFVLNFITTVIIGPIPTVLNFVFLPFLRFGIFLRTVLREFRPADDKKDEGDDGPKEQPRVLTSAMKAAIERREETKGMVMRKKKDRTTDEEKKERNEEILRGEAETTAEAERLVEEGAADGKTLFAEGVWQCVTAAVTEPIKARQKAADVVQFDLLLILTKPIFPLLMLISTGQVWNGLFSSIVIGQILRKIPSMSYEAHHLLCMIFGAVHTLLGVSAHEVEAFSTLENNNKVLALVWNWGFKDVLCVMHMCLLGSTMTAVSAIGNDPPYASSFAAGIALRIALAQDSVTNLSIFRYIADTVEITLRQKLQFSLAQSDEATAYSGAGIGDCGGGPFRMLLGDGPVATWGARVMKVWLILLPLMATGQWLLRTVQAGRMLGKKRKTTRFVQRLILFILGLMQCLMILHIELNASNGALDNFWLAMLLGCIGESLMSTFDVRGQIRGVVFLLLFIII